jgi:hypothetical protein
MPQKFAKALLDVADNLERAATSVPSEALESPDSMDRDKAVALLVGLHQGVDITQKVMRKVSGGVALGGRSLSGRLGGGCWCGAGTGAAAPTPRHGARLGNLLAWRSAPQDGAT